MSSTDKRNRELSKENLILVLILVPSSIGLFYGLITFGSWETFNRDVQLNGFSDAQKLTEHCFIGGPNGMSGDYTCIGGDKDEKLKACWLSHVSDESVIGNGTLYEICGGSPPTGLWKSLHWTELEKKH